MRGGGEIRQRHRIAGQPTAVIQQPGHVVEVILDRLGARLDVAAVGEALLHQLLVDPLVKQLGRHLVMELVIEPPHQAAHLVARLGRARHQRGFGIFLFEIFADRRAFGQRAPVDLEHRNLARRVAAQEVGILFPVAFLHQFTLDLLLGQAQPDLAAERG